MIRWYVISAVFKRNVMSYFSGLLGYLFIIVFVVASTYFAFQPEFFTDNMPTLDHLTAIFPWLLLFIVPAITMTTWAEERRSGTDELLFTLPGSDTEIVIGKYLSVVAIYTIALFFSTTQLIVLASLSSNVDWGIIFATYFGYWLAGASLLTAGMFASSVTKSTPVAFVLGSVFCVIPVGLGSFDTTSNFLRSLTVAENMRDFSVGLISLSSVLYFLSFAALMLYLNFIVINYRHWSSSAESGTVSNYFARAICLMVTFIALTYTASYALQPNDLSEEGLYTLSETTRDLLAELDESRPVEIQAFISPEVPRQYIETRKTLISLLDRLDSLGGDKISVRKVSVTPYDENSDEAETLGIRPVSLQREIDGRVKSIDVFMGALVRTSYDEVVIPFFGKGLPLEYELTRAIGTVSKEERLKIGILQTDAQVIQADPNSQGREWQLTTTLRMHYDVEAVDPSRKIPKDEFDVLLAVMPSSLLQDEMTNFVEYVRAGRPVVIFEDPVPLFMSRMVGGGRRMLVGAPKLPKPTPGGGGMMGMMGGGRQQAPPKADNGKASSLLDILQIAWEYDEIVWDQFNPHLQFDLGGEFIFVTNESSDSYKSISDKSAITSGMQELLLAYSGRIQQRENMDNGRTFTPLLTSSVRSTALEWKDFASQSFDPSTFSPAAMVTPVTNPELDKYAQVLAAHIEEEGMVNAIFVADIDMISDWFFIIRGDGGLPFEFDNVSFLMNCIDSLAGDDTYLELRKRRPTMRMLTKLQQQRDEFIREKNEEERSAEEEAEKQLELAKARFNTEREKINANPNLDRGTKQAQLENVARAEQRRVQVAQANIDREKNKKVKAITRGMERQIHDIEERARYQALFLSPLPAVVLGLVMMTTILLSEKKNVSPERAVR
ncbi:MAG: Gldg family protein [Planctomycetaceae bacterium]|jgi:ABC-2 type transport system permease protein|nr:Gldg family protein [Planctomycetaceae bacterium]MDG2389248.1 Gldg family protein [Planctomycetaceae bacterium]